MPGPTRSSGPGLRPLRADAIEAVELAEAEARALIELHAGPDDELEAALDAREDERRIEAELAAIKESLRSRA